MDLKLLEELGLSGNEARTYIALLTHESATSGRIIQATNIASSRVYAALHKLIRLGLVTYVIKNKIRYYQGVKPEIFYSFLEEKKKRLDKLIPELRKIKIAKKDMPFIIIYEGFSGFRNAFRLIIETCTSKDEILTMGFSRPLKELDKLRLLLKNIDSKRIYKKIPMKIILNEEMRSTIGKDRKKEPYTSVKFMPQDYFSPSALNIFRDYVLIEIWEEIPTVIAIKNHRIAESFKNYFKFLWSIAHK